MLRLVITVRSLTLAVSCLVALLVTSSVSAQERPLLAVLDFDGAQAKLSVAEMVELTEIARKEALDRVGSHFRIITRENLVDLLKSHGKTLEKCQGECETETGRLIGADVVVSGMVRQVFGEYRFGVKAHDTKTTDVIGIEKASTKNKDDLPDLISMAMKKLCMSLDGSTRQRVGGNSGDAGFEGGHAPSDGTTFDGAELAPAESSNTLTYVMIGIAAAASLGAILSFSAASSAQSTMDSNSSGGAVTGISQAEAEELNEKVESHSATAGVFLGLGVLSGSYGAYRLLSAKSEETSVTGEARAIPLDGGGMIVLSGSF
jgi:hypothetical protein